LGSATIDFFSARSAFGGVDINGKILGVSAETETIALRQNKTAKNRISRK